MDGQGMRIDLGIEGIVYGIGVERSRIKAIGTEGPS